MGKNLLPSLNERFSLPNWLSSLSRLEFSSLNILKLICLLAGLEVLLAMLLYTFMRYWFYGYFSTAIMCIEPSDITTEPIHGELVNRAGQMIHDAQKKILFRFFPAIWFVSASITIEGKKRGTPHWKGILSCVILALLLVAYLVFLFWKFP